MDEFEDLKALGRGAFATVRLVRKKADGDYYVVKRFHVPMQELSLKERLEIAQEVKLLAHLSHTNIIRFVDNFVEHGVMHIVMEYCPGGTLYKKIILREGELFDENQIWEWFVQIVLALKYVHAHNVLHRDLKTQNIMLGGPQQRTIKLGDFGIAKILGTQGDMANTMVGTPHYLSPELCQGQVYDQKSDVWALGCVLYELCALNKPFDASNMPAIIFSIMRNKPLPIPTDYSDELRKMVDRLLQPNPKDRPSMEETFRMPIVQTHLRRWEQTCKRLSKPLPTPRAAPGRPRRHSPAARSALNLRRSSDSSGGASRRSSRASEGGFEPRADSSESVADDGPAAGSGAPSVSESRRSSREGGDGNGGFEGGLSGPDTKHLSTIPDSFTESMRTLGSTLDSDASGLERGEPVEDGPTAENRPVSFEELESMLSKAHTEAEGNSELYVRLLRKVTKRVTAGGADGVEGRTWERLGVAWAETGTFDDAIGVYRRALRAKTGHASLGAMEQLGNLLVRRAQQVWAMAKAGEWGAARKVAASVLLSGVSTETLRRGKLILQGQSSRSLKSGVSGSRSGAASAATTPMHSIGKASGPAAAADDVDGEDEAPMAGTSRSGASGAASPQSTNPGITVTPAAGPANPGAPGSLVAPPDVDKNWRDAAAALILEGLGLLERLCLLGETPERRALLGSAYKRRAWTGLGDSRRTDLEAAARAYAEAAELEVKQAGANATRYARLNQLMLEFLAGSNDNTLPEHAKELAEQVREVERWAKRQVQKSPTDVWLWVQLMDAKFLRWMLHDGVKDQTIVNGYIEQFAFGASQRVQSSVMDQMEFMVEVLSGRLAEEEDVAVRDVVAERLDMVVQLHTRLSEESQAMKDRAGGASAAGADAVDSSRILEVDDEGDDGAAGKGGDGGGGSGGTGASAGGGGGDGGGGRARMTSLAVKTRLSSDAGDDVGGDGDGDGSGDRDSDGGGGGGKDGTRSKRSSSGAGPGPDAIRDGERPAKVTPEGSRNLDAALKRSRTFMIESARARVLVHRNSEQPVPPATDKATTKQFDFSTPRTPRAAPASQHQPKDPSRLRNETAGAKSSGAEINGGFRGHEKTRNDSATSDVASLGAAGGGRSADRMSRVSSGHSHGSKRSHSVSVNSVDDHTHATPHVASSGTGGGGGIAGGGAMFGSDAASRRRSSERSGASSASGAVPLSSRSGSVAGGSAGAVPTNGTVSRLANTTNGDNPFATRRPTRTDPSATFASVAGSGGASPAETGTPKRQGSGTSRGSLSSRTGGGGGSSSRLLGSAGAPVSTRDEPMTPLTPQRPTGMGAGRGRPNPYARSTNAGTNPYAVRRRNPYARSAQPSGAGGSSIVGAESDAGGGGATVKPQLSSPGGPVDALKHRSPTERASDADSPSSFTDTRTGRGTGGRTREAAPATAAPGREGGAVAATVLQDRLLAASAAEVENTGGADGGLVVVKTKGGGKGPCVIM